MYIEGEAKKSDVANIYATWLTESLSFGFNVITPMLLVLGHCISIIKLNVVIELGGLPNPLSQPKSLKEGNAEA